MDLNRSSPCNKIWRPGGVPPLEAERGGAYRLWRAGGLDGTAREVVARHAPKFGDLAEFRRLRPRVGERVDSGELEVWTGRPMRSVASIWVVTQVLRSPELAKKWIRIAARHAPKSDDLAKCRRLRPRVDDPQAGGLEGTTCEVGSFNLSGCSSSQVARISLKIDWKSSSPMHPI
ncbi:hypothetical protein O6P43_018934 [Quillaja saponaria]|uniref:Uncharacterized protein n=1 Tax=Quillaja saponaria TaxID=32244 RepID=A0AAD7LJH5_QUISA|nr:hypothetical protein O6P43_018934 [Quillaja saponaria]